ncbi:MAG: tautomerase [Alphaproteobacteria bacterium]|jgi:phenylpyruvate tautomerase PptA (4-oxalocrotonate tautomerase family)|nr:tautomerase [Alphaproteobacteria bacterium]|tara:strand:- start:812 stop:1204 length:393 start_codon:yes stop_codon:yes gene_type:complete
MPHLQFEINKKLKKNCKQKFIAFIEESFSKIMQTGTDHIAITLRELEKENISLGRVHKNDTLCLMNLDIRSGRSKKQKIELVKTFMHGVEKFLKINKNNQYITFTNHKGIEFNFYEKSLSDWVKSEKDRY